MKKNLLTLALSLGMFWASAQTIPNGSFENWTTVNYSILGNYTVQASNFQSLHQVGMAVLTQTADPYQGSWAAKLQTKTNGVDTVFGYFINGMPCGPGNPNPGGIPYALQPTGFTGRYKCSVPAGDTAFIFVMFKKSGLLMANGQYMKKFYGNQVAYAAFSFSIGLGSAPDTVIIGAVSSNVFANFSGIPGSMLQLDSINFKGAANPANMNGSFENWSTGTYYTPDNWYMNGDSVNRAAPGYIGSYALLLQVAANGGGCGGIQASSSQVSTAKFTKTGPPKSGLPYTQQNDSLIGWYKFAPVGNDTAYISWNAYKTNSPIGSFWKQITGTTGGLYKRFSIPVTLGSPPDSMRVDIGAGKWPLGIAQIGSKLWIDGLQLKSAPLSIPLMFIGPQYNMSVYPNPSKGLINLVYDSESNSLVTLQVLNEIGQIIMTQSLRSDGSKNLIDLTSFSKGLYLIKTEQEGKVSTSRIIIE